MISVRVNEIFNYLSTDRKKVHDQCRQLGRVTNEQPRNAGSTSGRLGAVVENAEGGCSNSHAQLAQEVEYDDNIHALLSSTSLEDIESEPQPSLKRDTHELNCVTSVSLEVEEVPATTQGSAAGVRDSCKANVVLPVSISSTPKVKTKGSRDKSKHLKTDTVVSSEKHAADTVVPTECIPEKDSSVSQITNVCNLSVRSFDTDSNVQQCSSSQVSSRNRKKNRRNEDRSSSAATLDMRSPCGKTSVKRLEHAEHYGEAKLVENGVKNSSNSPCVEKSKQSKADASSKRQTALAASVEGVADVHCSSKASNKKCSRIADLDSFDKDCLMKVKPPVTGGILDSSKIDALDSFDDFVVPSHYSSKSQSCSVSGNDDQWTEVNRRFKRIIVRSETFDCISGVNGFNLNTVVQESGAHIETERQSDKVVIVIKGNNDQIQSAYNLITELANRPASRERSSKKHRGRSTGCRLKAKNIPPRAMFENCQVRVADTCKISSDSVVNTVASSSNLLSSQTSEMLSSKAGHLANASSENHQVSHNHEHHPERTVPPTPVKEYSLFDNIFSRTVEQVLGHRDGPPAVLSSRSSIYPMTSPFVVHSTTRQPSVAVDQALLAKAPGYRSSPPAASVNQFSVMPELPFHLASDIQWERRVRKYSDSSSSGRSSEDSGVGGCISNNGFTLLPNAGPTMTQFDLLVGDASDRSPPVSQAWYPKGPFYASDLVDDLPGREDHVVMKSSSSNTPLGTSLNHQEQYSIPDKPMTLPRIASDLNPNAPDFVFYPQHANDTCSVQMSRFAGRNFIPPVRQTVCSSFEVPSVINSVHDSGAIGSERKKFHNHGAKNFFDIDEFPPLTNISCETLPVAEFCDVGLQY